KPAIYALPLRNLAGMGYNSHKDAEMHRTRNQTTRCGKGVCPMTERSAMKRRVRGLLHRKWHGPLLALVVVALPLAVVGALVVWLLGLPTMQGQLAERFANAQGVAGWAVQVASLLYSLDSLDYTGIIAGLPGLAVLA